MFVETVKQYVYQHFYDIYRSFYLTNIIWFVKYKQNLNLKYDFKYYLQIR